MFREELICFGVMMRSESVVCLPDQLHASEALWVAEVVTVQGIQSVADLCLNASHTVQTGPDVSELE